jgi:hypothetical protein
MKLEKAGTSISQIEVTNISSHGIWIYVKSSEYFMPFEKFPWFRDAKISDILEVELMNDHHLRWEKLDVDLELDSLENPEKFPLVYKIN